MAMAYALHSLKGLGKSMAKRCKVFISYAHKDELRGDSKVEPGAGYPSVFLSRLQAAIEGHEELLTEDEIFFDAARLDAEAAWSGAIGEALSQCWLLIFLVSADSIKSTFCRPKELAPVLLRRVPVITVLLQPSTDWHLAKVRDPSTGAELGKLGDFHSGGLPKERVNMKPVSAWASEDAAWDDVCKRILTFMQGDNFREPGGVQSAPVQAEVGTVATADVASANNTADATRHAQLLRQHLHKAWRSLERHPEFVEDPLFSGLARPLTIEAVMARAVDLPGSTANLVKVGNALGRVWNKPESSAACDAFLRMLPVVVDRFIQNKRGTARLADHEPIWVRDALTAATIAAEQQNFGLALKSGKREPESVFAATPPAVELGMPGEFGPSLVNREAMRAIKRRRIGTRGKIDHDTVKATVDAMRDAFDVAVRVDAVGDYEDPMRRQQLCEYLKTCGIHTFFLAAEEQELPPEEWADFPIGSLEEAFQSAFPVEIEPQSVSPSTALPWSESRQCLRRLMTETCRRPDLAAQRSHLLDAIQTIQERIAAEPEAADAPTVRRCLGEIEKGFQGLPTQDPLRETLNLIRDGLKAAWPDLLKLMS